MNPAKTLATLSSGLLARKGHARPAMRPQGIGAYAPSPQALDDLGWNDMGQAEADREGDQRDGEVLAPYLTDDRPIDLSDTPKPAVLFEREALAEQIATPVTAVKPVSLATADRLRRETALRTAAHGRKAAFTLRLDADRHLRLRLASAIADRSSQALVEQALDHFLSTLPEVETLVAQLPPPKRRAK